MGRICSVCSHPERQAIEADLIALKSNREITRKFAVSKDAQWRHKEHCIKPILQEVKAQQEEETASTTISEMEWMRTQVHAIYEEAWSDTRKVPDLALKALAEMRRQNELRAKLEGELDEHSITITSIPEWRELRALLLDALAVHPQAKLAVIRALEAYDHDRITA